MKNIFLSTLFFGALCLFVYSCTKKTQTTDSCKKEGVVWTCKANGVTITPDSLYLIVDTLNNQMVMGVQDTASGFRSYINIYSKLVDFDLRMGKDQYGWVNANTSFGSTAKSINGNFAMHVNDNNTVCGNFFWHNNNAQLYVNQGQYANIPIIYAK